MVGRLRRLALRRPRRQPHPPLAPLPRRRLLLHSAAARLLRRPAAASSANHPRRQQLHSRLCVWRERACTKHGRCVHIWWRRRCDYYRQAGEWCSSSRVWPTRGVRNSQWLWCIIDGSEWYCCSRLWCILGNERSARIRRCEWHLLCCAGLRSGDEYNARLWRSGARYKWFWLECSASYEWIWVDEWSGTRLWSFDSGKASNVWCRCYNNADVWCTRPCGACVWRDSVCWWLRSAGCTSASVGLHLWRRRRWGGNNGTTDLRCIRRSDSTRLWSRDDDTNASLWRWGGRGGADLGAAPTFGAAPAALPAGGAAAATPSPFGVFGAGGAAAGGAAGGFAIGAGDAKGSKARARRAKR